MFACTYVKSREMNAEIRGSWFLLSSLGLTAALLNWNQRMNVTHWVLNPWESADLLCPMTFFVKPCKSLLSYCSYFWSYRIWEYTGLGWNLVLFSLHDFFFSCIFPPNFVNTRDNFLLFDTFLWLKRMLFLKKKSPKLTHLYLFEVLWQKTKTKKICWFWGGQEGTSYSRVILWLICFYRTSSWDLGFTWGC